MAEMGMLAVAKETYVALFFLASYACDTFGKTWGKGRWRQIALAKNMPEVTHFYPALLQAIVIDGHFISNSKLAL